jgi:Zn-dependent metalloprotease
MRLSPRPWIPLAAGLAAALAAGAGAAGPRAQSVAVSPDGTGAPSEWDGRIARMAAAGELAVRWERLDLLVPGRRHLRYAQLHQGVPVEGGELVQQLSGAETVSVFGTLYHDLTVPTRPTLTADQAVAVVEARSGVDLGPERVPELVVLPREGEGDALAYRVRALTAAGVRLYYIGAQDGRVLLERDDTHTQSAVGLGTGVLGDSKKMSARTATTGGGFVAEDGLRPPPLRVFDFRGDFFRALRFLNGEASLPFTELARDDDNTWTDGAVVDAHCYAGWTYDYYFKRFGRRGLDNNDRRIVGLVHVVRREDLAGYPDEVEGLFFRNAFYAGDGVVVHGEGLPDGRRDLRGRAWNYVAGALDVVAHEITHGVTEYSSNLVYEGESGALNEAFSDIMGTSAEFFFQPAGSGNLRADYLIAEDVVTPGGIRSMQNPVAYGHPDHYALRFTGPEDNGGVHINSSIVNHAFYLAVEGGRNRVSGLEVQGVGAANRDQVERVFYRAFTQMLPPRANFAMARAATLQAARDLFGSGTPAERAVTQAWTAVGVP